MVDVSSAFHCVSGFSSPARCRAWRGQVADIIPCIEKKARVVSCVWPRIKGKWVFSEMKHQSYPSCWENNGISLRQAPSPHCKTLLVRNLLSVNGLLYKLHLELVLKGFSGRPVFQTSCAWKRKSDCFMTWGRVCWIIQLFKCLQVLWFKGLRFSFIWCVSLNVSLCSSFNLTLYFSVLDSSRQSSTIFTSDSWMK